MQHRRPPTLSRYNRASSNSYATSTATVSEMIAETGAPTSQVNRETQRAAVANQLGLMVAGRTHSPPKASAGLTDSWQPPGAVTLRGPMVGLVHGHEKNRLRQQSAQKRRPPTAAGLKQQRHTPKAAEGIADFFQVSPLPHPNPTHRIHQIENSPTARAIVPMSLLALDLDTKERGFDLTPDRDVLLPVTAVLVTHRYAPAHPHPPTYTHTLTHPRTHPHTETHARAHTHADAPPGRPACDAMLCPRQPSAPIVARLAHNSCNARSHSDGS